MKYFEILMSLIYLGMGILLLVAPPQSANFASKYMLYIGILLVAYGLVRAYRVYKKYYGERYESENHR
jgi:hypothetical protein